MRKLALYCDQVIPENYKLNQRLLTLFHTPRPNIGYIPSASDPDGQYCQDRKTYYSALGIDVVVSCELDNHYQPENFARMLQCDGIHLSGGNTFHFLYWLKQRGLLQDLRRFVVRGGVLIGASAGAILMTPEISSTAFCEDAPLPGEELADLVALNLLDFAFFPHINVFPEHERQLLEYSRQHAFPIYGCADGDGIIVEDERIEFFGRVKKAENGTLTILDD
jgi:dipeptidase E